MSARRPGIRAACSGKENALDLSVRRIASTELFDNRREIIIMHAGEQYRLRITANNKLILTK